MCALPQDTPTLGFFETLYPPKKRLKKKNVLRKNLGCTVYFADQQFTD